MTQTNWNKRFLMLANHISNWSKDSTKVGAVIADKENRVLSIGYNGFPSGANDDVPERHIRPLKYLYTEHAERNAIFSAAKNGVSLLNSTIYLEWFPCADCARAIIQSGIKCVVCKEPDFNTPKWGEHFKVASQLFKECDIQMILFDKDGNEIFYIE